MTRLKSPGMKKWGWSAIVLSLGWGVAVAWSQTANNASYLGVLDRWLNPRWLESLVLLGAALIAAWGHWQACRHPWQALFAMIPLQFVLLLVAGSIIQVFFTGKAPTGQVYSRPHLVASLLPGCLMAIWYTISIVDFYRSEVWKCTPSLLRR